MNLLELDRPETSSDARRDFWFEDIYAELYSAIKYAESAEILVEVRDIGGIRRSMQRLIAHVRLAAAATKKIEEIDEKLASAEKEST